MGYETLAEGSFNIDVCRFHISLEQNNHDPLTNLSSFERLFCHLGNDLVGLVLQFLGYCPLEVQDLLYVSKSIARKVEAAQFNAFPRVDDATAMMLIAFEREDKSYGYGREAILYRAKALYDYWFNEAQSKEYDWDELFEIDDLDLSEPENFEYDFDEFVMMIKQELEQFISSQGLEATDVLHSILPFLCPSKKGVWGEFDFNEWYYVRGSTEKKYYTEREIKLRDACVEYLSDISLEYVEDFIFGEEGWKKLRLEAFSYASFGGMMPTSVTNPPSMMPFSLNMEQATLNCIDEPYCAKQYFIPCWLVYIANRILKPRGYLLNGTMIYAGSDRRDAGIYEMKDNIFTVHSPFIVKDGYARFSLPGLMNVSKRGKILIWGGNSIGAIYPGLGKAEIERMNNLYLLEIYGIEYRNQFFSRFKQYIQNDCLLINGGLYQRHFVPIRWRENDIEEEYVKEKLIQYELREEKKIQEVIQLLLES